ncbi:hypothetical protein NUH86_19955 [Sphingobium sp. JS3065]|nr:hypothetical protein [Sphingobium sp. JS3065]UZW57030.1 hypothetical protein NUH86_19955 [Sphingobium sp. JS3065]
MGQSMTVEEALGRQMEFPAIKALFDSDDIIEGPRAFSEKRAPRWRGI